MYLDEAQTIVRGRTACVGISLQTLTASMAALDLGWMAYGTAHGLRVRIFRTSAPGGDGWQLDYLSWDYHMTHALTYALAQWFTIQGQDCAPLLGCHGAG